MQFSANYIPTTLFSLKDSNSTNSGAKSLFLPSPYSIKMAILNQAITLNGEFLDGNELDKLHFGFIRDVKISYNIPENSFFCVNNAFVKILKPAREAEGFQQTVAFREYIYISNPIEIIFDVKIDLSVGYLKKYLHKINYFGKKGCFFQFIEYSDNPSIANVTQFDPKKPIAGILQEYDDFDEKATFDNANNFSSANAKRKKKILVIPIKSIGSSKSYTNYKSI